ncbi:MAG: T9SS type A sorting domain-containing protein [Flavobacteriales bacterium]
MLSIGIFKEARTQQLLFDQKSTGKSTTALVAMDFTYFNSNDCRIADDFVVPTGQTWYIDSIELHGFYNNPGQTPDSAGLSITIYENVSGAFGTSVFAQNIQANLDQNKDGIITATWQTPIQLSAGSYWLAAAAIKTYLFDGIQWYWYLNTNNVGNEAKWENPGGGFNTCTSWSNLTDASCLNQPYGNVTFGIYGCLGAQKATINELIDDTTFCEGPEIPITATSNSTGASFKWSTGDTTATILAGQSGLYTVTAYYPSTQCGSTASVYLDVIPSPKSTLKNDTICEGTSKIFSSFCKTCEFEWSDGSTNYFLDVSTQGWVSVTMTDTATGCVGVDSAWIELQPKPTSIPFLPSNPILGCIGVTQLAETVTKYKSYQWAGPGLSGIQTGSFILVTLAGDYPVTVTTWSGCEVTDTLRAIINPHPEPKILVDQSSANEWVTYLSTELEYASYKWSNGSTGHKTKALKNGPYSVTVSDSIGCSGSVSSYIIIIPEGLDELGKQGIEVFPNPASTSLNIQSTYTGDEAIIYDQTGRIVLRRPLNVSSSSVPVEQLDRGIYILTINNEFGVSRGSVTVILN